MKQSRATKIRVVIRATFTLQLAAQQYNTTSWTMCCPYYRTLINQGIVQSFSRNKSFGISFYVVFLNPDDYFAVVHIHFYSIVHFVLLTGPVLDRRICVPLSLSR